MGMGYSGDFAETITEQSVSKVCPTEFTNFKRSIDESHEDLDEFAQCLYFETEADDVPLETVENYKHLCSMFYKKTGLALDMGWHDPDAGSRYDEVSGHFWAITSEIHELTPEAKAFQKQGYEITRKFFVNFG